MSGVDTLPERHASIVMVLRGIHASGDWVRQRIEEAPVGAFLLLTMFYAVVVAVLSSMKLLWLDELITLHIARLGSPHAIWAALKMGADPNPPLTHLAVSFFRALFGEHELALRAPAALGYWVGLASLSWFLKRRLPAEWALCGAVLSMTMAAFDYSFESRSYGIFYGLAMLAFLCWSLAVDSSLNAGKRWTALCGMGGALALGICTNYFAVLAFLPIAIGEAARATFHIWRRKWETADKAAGFEPAVWVAMLLAGIPLLLFRPLIAHSIAQFAPYAWNRVSLQQVEDSYTQMVEITLWPLLALFAMYGLLYLLARYVSFRARPTAMVRLEGFASAISSKPAVFPIYERAGVLGLMAYPLLGYVVATFRGGMLSPRFVIPVCFGFAIAGIAAAYRIFGQFTRAGVLLLGFCLAWFCARESYVGYWYEEQKQCLYKVIDHLPEAELETPPGSAVLIPDPLLALTLEHYAQPPLRRRLVFPVDFPAIRQYRHDDSPEQNLWAGRGTLYTVPIVTMADFQRGAGDYLIIAGDGNWLLSDLDAHHYDARRLPINPRAGAIGGFTPLCRGVPAYYVSHGDTVGSGPLAPEFLPVPFEVSANLPDTRP